MVTLGKNCYAVWGQPRDVISHTRGADGSLTSEVVGFSVGLDIVVEMIKESDILTEEAIYVTRGGGQITTGDWTGVGPTSADGTTWPWPYEGVAQPAANQFEFLGLVTKANSFRIGGLTIAFDCVWSFRAFVRNTL